MANRNHIHLIVAVSLVVCVSRCSNKELASPPEIEASSVLVGNLNQVYRTTGSGPPLLLIHGLTETWRVWEPFIEPLAVHYQLIIPDIRGHGETENPNSSLTPGMVADDLLALLDALDIKKVRVAGYSFGAHTALRMAATQSERIESMVIVAGAHRLIGWSADIHRELMDTDLPGDWYLDIAREWHPGGEEQIQQVWRQGIAGVLEEEFTVSDDVLKNMSTRTLIVQGDRDNFFPLEVSLDLHAKI